MADFDRLDKAVEAVKNAQVPTGPSQDLAQRTLRSLQTAREESELACGHGHRAEWVSGVRKLWPLATAAVLIAGFFLGRLTQPRRITAQDLAGLEQSLYTRLHQSLAAEVQASQAETTHRLASDVNAVLDQRLPVVAGQVLLASNSATTQVIRDLVQIIRDNQVQQGKKLATALGWIESDRRDQAQLNNRFASFAVATERNLSLLAGRQGTAEPSPQTHQSSDTERN